MGTKAHYHTLQTIPEKEKLAHQKGLIVFYSTPSEIFLDFDGGAVLDIVVRTIIEASGVELVDELVTTSESGLGSHIYLRLKRPVSRHEALLLEALMTGDRRHAANNFALLSKDFTSSVLFETTQEAARVLKWRSQYE